MRTCLHVNDFPHLCWQWGCCVSVIGGANEMQAEGSGLGGGIDGCFYFRFRSVVTLLRRQRWGGGGGYVRSYYVREG